MNSFTVMGDELYVSISYIYVASCLVYNAIFSYEKIRKANLPHGHYVYGIHVLIRLYGRICICPSHSFITFYFGLCLNKNIENRSI